MANIELNISNLKKISRDIIEYSINIDTSSETISSIISSIDSNCWDGKDSIAYKEAMHKVSLNLNDLYYCLWNYGNDLKKYCDDFEMLEEYYTNKKIDI